MARFSFGENEVEIIQSETLTVRELLLIRELFGIDGLDVLDSGLEVLEPGALRALLAISALRADPTANPLDESILDVVVRPLATEMLSETIDAITATAEDESPQ